MQGLYLRGVGRCTRPPASNGLFFLELSSSIVKASNLQPGRGRDQARLGGVDRVARVFGSQRTALALDRSSVGSVSRIPIPPLPFFPVSIV